MPSFTENHSDSSDLSLAARLQDGSAESWGEFVDLYAPLVETWCGRAGLDAAAKEDIAQDVFLSVHRSLSSFDATVKNASFRGWLWRITRNALLQRLRKSQRQLASDAKGGSTAYSRLAAVADPVGNPSGSTSAQQYDSVALLMATSEKLPPDESSDTASLLRRAMVQIKSKVDEKTWKAFWNCTVLSQPTALVAESLDMTPMAVRKAKSRTLQRLRRQLGDQM